jgi:hypothetical protein
MLSRMFPLATHRHVRLATLLGLALVHAAVLMWLARLDLSPDRSPPPQQHPPLVIRLLSWMQPNDQKQPTPVAAPKPKANTAIAPAPWRAPNVTVTPDSRAASAAENATENATENAPGASPTPSPPAPTQPAVPALNLALPRAASAAWRQRPAPMDDARANTAKATFESKLQAAMGGHGQWAEERIDGDRVRFRRGDTCVDFSRSRAEQLDSFNQSFGPKPWVTPGPKPC